MTRSIWRLSHLLLALVASLFLIVLPVSGILLAFEPIQAKTATHSNSDWDQIPLKNVVDTLQANYLEVTSIEKNEHGHYNLSAMNDNGDFLEFQLNPATGKKVGEKYVKSSYYDWLTTFHRSLFSDQLGRFIVGIVAVILLFIAVSGMILIIQRTKSLKALFTKVEKSLNVQFYHIVFGRLAFIPITIIALTGSYLFLQRFKVIPTTEPKAVEVNFEQPQNLGTFDFSKMKLGDIQKMEFPFSPDEEDYFILQTKEKEIAVDQYNYTILAEEKLAQTTIYANLSLQLHTGRGTIIWAIILGIASLSILYFIYSGFKMTWLSLRGKTKNKYTLQEADLLLLVGSETGNTRALAKLVYQQLIASQQKVHITELNNYQPSPTIKQVLIFASTHGVGEAPASAKSFIQRWKSQPLTQQFNYSIVGFGSLAYADFCKYASDIEDLFKNYTQAKSTLPIVKIHNQSYHALKSWSLDWSKATGIQLQLPASIETKKLSLSDFEVLQKESVTVNGEETVVLSFKSIKKLRFQSGDLLTIYPSSAPAPRYYSIGKTGTDTLTICVKKHELGVCSNLLANLKLQENLHAAIKPNSEFHFNTKKAAILIGNGTGIGPFLGMADENKWKNELHIYWGGRSKISYSLFENWLTNTSISSQISSINLAFSREETPKEYVYQLVERDQEKIIQLLKNKAVIYICGSLAMQQNVLDTLEQACQKHANKSLKYFQEKGQLKLDSY